MKYRLIILTALSFIVLTSFVSDDNCEGYFPYKEGTELEYTHYDKKGKEEGRSTMVLKEKKNTDKGLEIVMGTTVFDKKDNEAASGDFIVRCEGDKFYMDMNNMLPPETLEAMGEMEVEVESDFLEFPSSPQAGQSLPDGTMKVTTSMNGIPMMTITVFVTDRKIEGFESITTPAGTFECLKYTFKTSTKMMFTVETENITWMAKDVGNVRSESYSKGKLEGYTELTSAKL